MAASSTMGLLCRPLSAPWSLDASSVRTILTIHAPQRRESSVHGLRRSPRCPLRRREPWKRDARAAEVAQVDGASDSRIARARSPEVRRLPDGVAPALPRAHVTRSIAARISALQLPLHARKAPEMAAKLARTLPSAASTVGAPLASTSTAPAVDASGQPAAVRRPLRTPIAPRFGARLARRSSRKTVAPASAELEALFAAPATSAPLAEAAASGSGPRRGRSTVFDPPESEILSTVARFTAPIELPPRLAVRACTHKSIVEGTTRNHNGRLAFMGPSALSRSPG